MAGTEFGEIFDLFMSSITDYKLVTLFNSSPTDFETYLSGWLIPSIGEFTTCDQSLAYSSSTFTETLSQKNINILMLLMKRRWLEKEIDNVTQMHGKIQDKDFKNYSEAQNMTAKQNRLMEMKEEVSQKLVDYGLNTTDWTAWFNQEFYIP